MTPNPKSLFQETVNIHRQKRQAAKIADYLMTVLRIPEGSHLVMFFSDGGERCNRDAIAAWVERTIHECDADEAEVRLQQLAKRAHLQVISKMDES